MKFRIGTIEFVERAAVAAALEPRESTMESAALASAERSVRDLEAKYARLAGEVSRLREAVARNAASPQALESKLLEFTACEQAMRPAAEAVETAREIRDRATRRFADDRIAHAVGLRDELQAIVTERLAPVLEELRVLERELDRAVHRLSTGRTAQVPPLEWPASLVDEAFAVRMMPLVVTSRGQSR